MNELYKNPIVVFLAIVVAIWAAMKLLSVFLSVIWVVLLAGAALYVLNERFRRIVGTLFRTIFK